MGRTTGLIALGLVVVSTAALIAVILRDATTEEMALDGALTTKYLNQAVSASQRRHDPYGGGFRDGNGEDVSPPDRVEYEFGARRGWLAVVFQDGDAYVRFDGDAGDTLVKWRSLCKVPAWADDPGAAAGCPFDGEASTPGASAASEGTAASAMTGAHAGDVAPGATDATERLLRDTLARRIRAAVTDRGLTMAGAAAAMGITVAEADDLMWGSASGLATERFPTLLNRLGVSVRVSFAQEPGFAPGETTYGWDLPRDDDAVGAWANDVPGR